ncbi:MMPL family transporter, partial [Actinoplanes sp. NPDC048791]
MNALSRFVVAHRWWVLVSWLLLAAVGGFAAPKATAALSYDFSLPGQDGYETNKVITEQFGSGGDFSPILLVIADAGDPAPVVQAATAAVPGARILSPADEPALRAPDGRTSVVVVYP